MSTKTAESYAEDYPIHKAIASGNVLEVKEKIKEYPSHINSANYNNFSPLMEASWFGFATIAKVLVENGADIHFKGGKYESSSLHLAAQEAKSARWSRRSAYIVRSLRSTRQNRYPAS